MNLGIVLITRLELSRKYKPAPTLAKTSEGWRPWMKLFW